MLKKIIGLILVFTLFLSIFMNSYASVNLNAANEKEFIDILFDAEEGDKVTFGRWYESGIDDGSNVDRNKMIPLKWTVVSWGTNDEEDNDGKYLRSVAGGILVCDYVVNKMQFAVTENGGLKNGSWDYHNSNVKQWLNSNFYNNAFSDEEKKYITPINPHFKKKNSYMKNKKESGVESSQDTKAKVNIPGISDLEYFGVEIGKNNNDKWDIFYRMINDGTGKLTEENWDFVAKTANYVDGTNLRVWNSKGERAKYSYWLADVGNTEYTTKNGEKIKHPCVYVEGDTYGLLNGYIAENNGAIFGLFDADRYNSMPQPKIAEQISPNAVHGVRPMIYFFVEKNKELD